MDIATLVKNITTAFEEASALVQRIRTRKKEQDPNAHTEPIDDLLTSLSLGPTVVKGYYESDARRFGNAYMTGDSVAREQLKDSLINLQMTVLSSLGAVILNDRDPDYDAIQSASDECRVNVGVCLGQLSQRMSKAARGFNVAGKIPVYDNGQVKTMQRSNSRTQSSSFNQFKPMTPPESETEYLGEASVSTSPPKQVHNYRSSEMDIRDGRQPAYGNSHLTVDDQASLMPLMYQRPPPTGPLPKPPESPVSPQDALHPTSHRARESSNSMSTTSTRSNQASMYSPQAIHETFGSSPGYIDNNSNYFAPKQAYDSNRMNFNSELTSATWTRTRTGSIGRKPVQSVYDNMVPQPLATSSSYNRRSIPEDEKEVVYHSPVALDRGMSLSGAQGMQTISAVTSPGSENTTLNLTSTRTSTGPLTLPTEKNLLGFCKGAFRLQCGIEKKAFSIANRPMGFSAMMQYWKCEKCYFEGPCTIIVPPGKKKPEKIFDPVIRDYEGIRYKWVFLAKCHVPLRSMPEGKRDGSFGGFCCIFCTAEAAQRGWPQTQTSSTTNTDVSTRRTSVWSTGSGSSGQQGASAQNFNCTAVFGNIHGLMDHLQMHRQPEFWPGVEMQGRLKCVVGKIAQRGEEFDINLMPLS